MLLLSVAGPGSEQRRQLVSQLFEDARPLLNAGGMLLAVLAVCALRSGWSGYLVLAAADVAVIGARLWQRAAWRGDAERRDAPYWATHFAVGAAAAALLWGAASLTVLLRGHDVPLELFVLMAQAGWLGGAAVGSAASPAAVVAQVLCALVPALLGALLTRPGFVQIAIPFLLVQLFATLGMARLIGGQIGGLLVSEQRLAGAHAQLLRLSATDTLTGLANRAGFDAALRVEWARAAREASDIALLLAQVDHFPEFIKLYRSLAGEDCLRGVAILLEAALRRPADLAARFDGTVFAALLPATGEDGARDVGDRLARAVRAAGTAHAASPLGIVSVGIGVASLAPSPGADPQVLIALARAALEDAQRAGEDQMRGAAARLRLGNWQAARSADLAPPATGLLVAEKQVAEETALAGDACMDRTAIPRGLKILVLEDDQMVSQLMDDMLRHAGCSVVGLCATEADGLAAIAREMPQVALLDVHLGNGENGYAVAEALAAHRVPFAFVTGDGAAKPPASFGARPVLVKPFHLAALMRLVGELAREK